VIGDATCRPCLRQTLFAVVLASLALSATSGPVGASDLAEHPFSADSPWNVPLPAWTALDSSDTPCSQDVVDAGRADINAATWSVPVATATDDDPLVDINVGGESVGKLRVPNDAKPALPAWPQDPDADSHLAVIDPTYQWVDEFWRAQRTAGGVQAESHSRVSLSGPGVGAGGERAYGGSAIAGLIRTREIADGEIRHALALALPRTSQALGPVWPAVAQDTGAEGSYFGHVHMGTRIALPAVDIGSLGLSPAGTAIAVALQRYGAYDVDSASGGPTLFAEPTAENLVEPARHDLERLRPLLRCVSDPSAAPLPAGPTAQTTPPTAFPAAGGTTSSGLGSSPADEDGAACVMPRLTRHRRLSWRGALAALARAGCHTAHIKARPARAIPRGTVSAQRPPAGSSLHLDAAVTLTLETHTHRRGIRRHRPR
jgi:hypothetical protein